MIRRILLLMPLLCTSQRAWGAAVVPPTNLSDVVITGGLVSGANVSASQVTVRSGGQAATVANRFSGWCDPVQDFGADPTGVKDSAAAINSCLSSGAPTKLPAGTYLVSSGSIVLQTGSVLDGAGVALTSLVLASKKNFDVVQSYSADSWAGTNVQQGTNNWSLSNLTINGAASSQTATGTARNLVNGITSYGWHWRISDVLIENVLGNGIRSDAYSAGPTPSVGTEIASHADHVIIDTANRHGWWNNTAAVEGDNITVINASQETASGYDGFYFTAGGNYDNLHAQFRSGGSARMAYDLYSTGGVTVTNSQFDGAAIGWVYHGNGSSLQSFGDSISNSEFLNNDGAGSSGGEVFAGNANNSDNNQYFCNSSASTHLNAAGNAIYAIQIGVSGSLAGQYNRVAGAVFSGCSDLSPVNLADSGGYNSIAGVSQGVTGGATTVGGTFAVADSINVQQSSSPLAATVDLSANSTKTASAPGSVISGGYGHSVGGSYNVIAGGNSNAASGNYSSIPGGENATDRGIYGRLCYQSGAYRAALGDHQVCWQTQSGTLSAAGTVELLTGSDQTTASAANTLALPANDLGYGFSCEVNVVNSANGDAGQFYIDHALVSRASGVSSVLVNGGTSSIALSQAALIGTLASAGISVAAGPDTTIGGLKLTATETGSLTLHFSATCETREVQ